MNIHTLYYLRGQENPEDNTWKHQIADILLNIEDNMVKVQLEDDLAGNVGFFGQEEC